MEIRKDSLSDESDTWANTSYAPLTGDAYKPDYAMTAVSGPATLAVPPSAYLFLEWHLTSTWSLHADQVWADYTGAGIRVTDLDDGFQTSHPDYAANYRTDLSRDFVTGGVNGAEAYGSNNHGTAVLGEIIGNGAGGAGSLGVAYGAEAFGMRMGFGSDGDQSQVVDGFQYALAAQADVMNNSWGYTDFFGDDFGFVSGDTYFSSTLSAMEDYIEHGRSNLGGVIVFAAGNAREDGDNTNYHNMTNSPYVITVAAIDENGIVADFSTPGSSILVSAGGVDILTTDRTGSAGYVSGSYVYFSGTSAAAPLVSGTAALMLQANPNLGWRDVQEILAYSAQHNDAASAGWQVNDARNWNGGGLYYSTDYGFGAANALAAVRLAESWTAQHSSANMVSVETGTISSHQSITAATLSSTVTITQNINIEHILVDLDISENRPAGLTVALVGPGGTSSVLLDGPAYTWGSHIEFQTSTVANWGEMSAGTWTLQVSDSVSGSVGTLNSWGLTFLGSVVTNDDTYIYTNEFASFTGAALASRAVISDTNGGTDMLNLSAVTSASTVDLAVGTATIAGKAVTFTAGSIESVYGGDGNDMLTGSASANQIYGGRGNDTITISAGNDVIDGGRGTDKVVYGSVITNFSITITDSTHQTITDTTGSLGAAAIRNVETFVFSGVSYTVAQLQTYLASLGSSSGSSSGGGASLDNITLSFAGRGVVSASSGVQTLTAADLGSRGMDPCVEVSRDASGLVLNYLGTPAPKSISIDCTTDDTVTLTGLAPAKLKAMVTVGDNDGSIHIDVNAAVTITGGNGDNTIIGSNTGSNKIYVGDGDNEITVGGSKNTVSVGSGDNDITLISGKNTVSTSDGDDTIHINGGANKISVGGGHNVIYNAGGSDKIALGSGADTLVFTAVGSIDKISGFDAAGGDVIDISDVLSFSGGLVSDYVTVGKNGALSIDADGAVNGLSYTSIASIKGLSMDVQTLFDDGALILF